MQVVVKDWQSFTSDGRAEVEVQFVSRNVLRRIQV